MTYTLYYRNYARSCNYRCNYCPFPKEAATPAMLTRDKQSLFKFVNFIAASHKQFNLFFAPRGEALLHDYYRQALIEASWLENVHELVIQTNLSCGLEWLAHVNANKLILWTTYHPGEVDAASFFRQVKRLVRYTIRFTIGVVGVKENFNRICEMKGLLRQLGKDEPYMWINAYKDKKNYYHAADIEFLEECDPLIATNLKDYPCKDSVCQTGQSVFFVEWNGNIHRCWQDKTRLGNLYVDDLDFIRVKNNCRQSICGCFIGYSHMTGLHLEKVYGNSLLGRIP